MNILYLVHQFYPQWYTGTEKFVLSMATVMQKAGNRVKVLTYGPNDASTYEHSLGNIAIREFVHEGIPVVAVKHNKPVDDRLSACSQPQLDHELDDTELSKVAAELIDREKPDVVHVGHSMRMGELVKVLPLLKIPYIVTLTDFFLICPKFTLVSSGGTLCSGPEGGRACKTLCPEFPKPFIKRRLKVAREILLNASLVVSPSRIVATLFQKEFPDLDIKIVSYGLKESTLRSNGKHYATGDGITFAYAGSLNPHKGVHLLIEAFQKVAEPRARLQIHGSGPDASYTSRLMAMAKQDRRIEFRGVYAGERVGEILGSVDVLVLPSLWYENCPFTLCEALACRVPVVASNVGGMAETIKDGITGFLFRMGDPQHLQNTLQRIASGPEVLNAVKRNIQATCIPTIEQEGYVYERAYAQISK